MRSLWTATREKPAQKQRPNTAKNKQILKKKKKKKKELKNTNEEQQKIPIGTGDQGFRIYKVADYWQCQV